MNRLVAVCLLSCSLLVCTGCGARSAKASGNKALARGAAATRSPGQAIVETATPAPPKVAKELSWKPFKASDGSFTMNFPGDPKVDSHKGGGNGTQTQYIVELADGTTYGVVLNEIPQVTEDLPSEAERLKAIVKNVGKFYGPTARLVAEKEIKVAGASAIEYTVTFDDKGKKLTLTTRAFFAREGHQLFQLVAGGPAAFEAEKFFTSFQLAQGDRQED